MDAGHCPDCPCCWENACHSGYDAGCPTGEAGESLCPCTESDVI